jgi:hypothetical protein
MGVLASNDGQPECRGVHSGHEPSAGHPAPSPGRRTHWPIQWPHLADHAGCAITQPTSKMNAIARLDVCLSSQGGPWYILQA